MGKTVAVSFEESNIKIVRAIFSGGSCSIETAEIIEYDEFDNYLQNENATEFIVTYDFKEAYHGFLSIPSLKPRYQQRIIESELRKNLKLTDISFTYVPVEERQTGTRKELEIFYFAVSNEVIHDTVGRFYDYNKIVRAIYPTVFSASSLIKPSKTGEANMGIFGTGREKIVFFTKDRSISFIRNYESIDDELSDFDVQNINMTISYCSQNIHIQPSSVMLLGNLTESSGMHTLPSTPMASLYKGDDIKCSGKVFRDFFLPIASLSAPKSSNILSEEFKNINMLKGFMVYASKVFVSLIILSLVFLFFEIEDAVSRRNQIEATMTSRSDIENIYSIYSEKKDYIDGITPLINFLNRPVPDLQKLLIDLAEVRANNLRFHSVEAGTKNGNAFSVTINGASLTDTYASLQNSFSALIEDLDNVKDIRINNKSVNLRNKTFKIELTYQKTR